MQQKSFFNLFLFLLLYGHVHGQGGIGPGLEPGTGTRFSAVNPALFLYSADDVYINAPTKHNNGAHLVAQNKTSFPWEDAWDNGYPNVFVTPTGNVAAYLSVFTFFDPNKKDSQTAIEFLRTNNQLDWWLRPDLGVLHYDASTAIHADKVNNNGTGQSTNLIAEELETMGITAENNDLRLVYRIHGKTDGVQIFNGHTFHGYKTTKSFDSNEAFSFFTNTSNPFNSYYTRNNIKAPFLSADTHNKVYAASNGHSIQYYFTTRLRPVSPVAVPGYRPNGNRPAGAGGPTTSDEKKQWRRSYAIEIDPNLDTSVYHSELTPLLDPQDNGAEPYSLQPYRLPGFEGDILWGLVTMYDNACKLDCWTNNDWDTQWTELAISTDGRHWKYLKPGTPFIPNGHQEGDSNVDDLYTVNAALPVMATRFHNTDYLEEQYYFYVSSKEKHKDSQNRVGGISLAKGDYGKMAGLHVPNINGKTFYSMNPKNTNVGVDTNNILKLSLSDIFFIGANTSVNLNRKVKLGILADVTNHINDTIYFVEDIPASYVSVNFHAYDANDPEGTGELIFGGFANATPSNIPSKNYDIVPYISNQFTKKVNNLITSNSKNQIFTFLAAYQRRRGGIVSTKKTIPIVIRADVANATFYGFQLEGRMNHPSPLKTDPPAHFTPPNPIYSLDLTGNSVFGSCSRWNEMMHLQSIAAPVPNQVAITDLPQGAIAIKVRPSQANPSTEQFIFGLWGDDNNHIAVTYGTDGKYHYRVRKDAVNFIDFSIAPVDLSLSSFHNQTATITIENINKNKYGPGSWDPTQIVDGTSRNIVPNMRVKVGSSTHVVVPTITLLPDLPANFKHNADTRISHYDIFASFLPTLDRAVTGFNGGSGCSGVFQGNIYGIEVSTELPTNSDFYSSALQSLRTTDDHPQAVVPKVDLVSNELQVYPNPTQGNINVGFNIPEFQLVRISLLDLNGKIVARLWNRDMDAGNYNFNFPLASVPAGMYLLQVQTPNNTRTEKLVIQ